MTLIMKLQGNIRYIVISAFVAAIYVVATVALGDLAYKEVQFRVAEVMLFLVFIDPLYIPGLTLGCFIANLFGPFGIIDAVFGSIATVLALCVMYLSGKLKINRYISLFIGSLGAVVFNAVYVPLLIIFTSPEIGRTFGAFWGIALSVGIGEFAVVSVAGVVLWGHILKKDSWVSVFKQIRS